MYIECAASENTKGIKRLFQQNQAIGDSVNLKRLAERKRNRLLNYDYSKAECYFVTISTQNHVHYFGEINGGEMKLNDCGRIAERNWKEIPNHFENIQLDIFVIMPNHMHGIIVIKRPVGNAYMRSLRKEDRTKMVLSKVIQQYKFSVTRDIGKQHGKFFSWQKSFYDAIIRNEKEFYNIQGYIFGNPVRWEFDLENINCSHKNSENYYTEIFTGR